MEGGGGCEVGSFTFLPRNVRSVRDTDKWKQKGKQKRDRGELLSAKPHTGGLSVLRLGL